MSPPCCNVSYIIYKIELSISVRSCLVFAHPQSSEDLFLTALLITCNNNLSLTLPPPVYSPYHSKNIYQSMWLAGEPTLWRKTLWRLHITLGKVLTNPVRPCTSTPVSRSGLTSHHSCCLQTPALLFPAHVQHVATSGFPLLTTLLLQVLLQSLLKCLFFRKALPHYLIKNSLCHTLSACWLHFSSDDLHYVFICSLSISTLRVYIPLVKALYLIHLSTLGSRTAPGT